MSSDPMPVLDPPAAEEAPSARVRVGDPLPAVCEFKDLARLLGLSIPRIWTLHQQHAFDFARLEPALPGTKARFSGKKLQQWIDGELAAGRPFFGRGRR